MSLILENIKQQQMSMWHKITSKIPQIQAEPECVKSVRFLIILLRLVKGRI